MAVTVRHEVSTASAWISTTLRWSRGHLAHFALSKYAVLGLGILVVDFPVLGERPVVRLVVGMDEAPFDFGHGLNLGRVWCNVSKLHERKGGARAITDAELETLRDVVGRFQRQARVEHDVQLRCQK